MNLKKDYEESNHIRYIRSLAPRSYKFALLKMDSTESGRVIN